MTDRKPQHIQTIDVAIIGGGIAGMWLLNLLSARGYQTALFESNALGCDQTLASQGMIHGGLKYALGGSITGAAEAIASMPERWRNCLAVNDTSSHDPDLHNTRLMSPHYHMFATRSALGRLTGFFASKALRGRINKLERANWPSEFDGFDGVVYRLNDFVIDTADLLGVLSQGHEDKIFHLPVSAKNIKPCDHGFQIQLNDTTLHAGKVISCAGNGSQSILNALNITNIQTQQRPLKQVIVRPTHNVSLYAHCLTGISNNEPRLTITSHPTGSGLVWYLGGRLATSGVRRTDDQQIAFARTELATCVPWLDWQGAQYDVISLDRAEPLQTSGHRPDQAFVDKCGDFIQCFPTKLTLAPDLGDRTLAALPPPANLEPVKSNHPLAKLGKPPW